MQCQKCKGEMEEGLIIDRFSHTGASLSQRWGTKKIALGLLGVQKPKDVKTYRCKECGYLESYAK